MELIDEITNLVTWICLETASAQEIDRFFNSKLCLNNYLWHSSVLWSKFSCCSKHCMHCGILLLMFIVLELWWLWRRNYALYLMILWKHCRRTIVKSKCTTRFSGLQKQYGVAIVKNLDYKPVTWPSCWYHVLVPFIMEAQISRL